MRTNLKQTITNLEHWLNFHSLEHEARSEMEARLKKAQEQFDKDNTRPIERDTFCFLDQQFTN